MAVAIDYLTERMRRLMGNGAKPVTVKKLDEKNGISFYLVPSDKFKTTRVDLFFIEPLRQDTVSQNALLPFVLRRGCGRYPTQQDLALRLEELYGAGIDTAVLKKGENQIIHFSSVLISDRFTPPGTRLFSETGDLLLEILTQPALEDGLFRMDYFIQEKENLIQRIRSRVNDKMQYAMQRCLEEMCTGEPYAIYEDGDEESAGSISPEDLMNRYRKLLAETPLFVYISGDIREDEIRELIHKFDRLQRGEVRSFQPPTVKKEAREVRQVEEPMDVSQGKLCLGFRTQIEANSPDYFPLAIYNGILGGGIQSKLFQNVREKESLAYTTFSRLEKFKSLLVAVSGIEISNRDKAEKVIMEQLDAIRKGQISALEMEATKKSLETGVKSMQDSQGGMVDFYLSQLLSGENDDVDTFLQKLMSVEKEDVVRVSEKITLDTVYFLTSLSGEAMERSE